MIILMWVRFKGVLRIRATLFRVCSRTPDLSESPRFGKFLHSLEQPRAGLLSPKASTGLRLEACRPKWLGLLEALGSPVHNPE